MLDLIFLILDISKYMGVYVGIYKYTEAYEGIWSTWGYMRVYGVYSPTFPLPSPSTFHGDQGDQGDQAFSREENESFSNADNPNKNNTRQM